mmetsp:Transcript_9477/g.15050  ORF Transcript_9477/g.15050 Transcript_9477/m.15050 type:complete len:221 (-) Transcript_9477:494-1156(-)
MRFDCGSASVTWLKLRLLRSGWRGRSRLSLARLSVFFSSMAMVIGPTPPGTGVMREATRLASPKCTSPTSRWPSFFVGSSIGLIPTSMTTQPGFSQSPLTISALPSAATKMSACCTFSFKSLVREWHTVTVAFMDCSSAATGIPTMFERPSTTASFPLTSTPLRCNISMQPAGVHGTAIGGSPPFRHRLPMFRAEKPSTSLHTLIIFRAIASSMWSGKGS